MQKTNNEKMLQIKKLAKSEKFKNLINLLEDHEIATFALSLKEDFTEDELLNCLVKYLKQKNKI